jgi:hypothetical protein
MRRASNDDYDATAAADRHLFREGHRVTAGASAYHQLDPSEIAMRLEEYDPLKHAVSERWALRNEIFSGFVEYVFADGPAPGDVRERIEGFFRSFHPLLADKIRGPLVWTDRDAVAAVLRKHHAKLTAVAAAHRSRGSLSGWHAELETEIDIESVREMLVELVKFMASEGNDWRRITAVAYCIAKALRPALIAGMSLHDIAILSGDDGGRATPQNRIKRLFNDRVEAAGFKGIHVHFQKSATAIRRMSEAQLGNNNRAKKNPTLRKKTKTDPRKS